MRDGDRNAPADQTQAPTRQNKARDPLCPRSGLGPADLLKILRGCVAALGRLQAEVGFWRPGVEAAGWVGQDQLPLNSADQDTRGLAAEELNTWVREGEGAKRNGEEQT